MKRSSQIVVFITTLFLNTRMNAAELPVIQMPEYIINGIEQATSIAGDRLQSNVTSTPAMPIEIETGRPVFAGGEVVGIQDTPGVLRPTGQGYQRASLRVGTQANARGEAAIAGRFSQTSYQVSVDGNWPPDRSGGDQMFDPKIDRVGLRRNVQFDGSAAREVEDILTIQPRLSIQSRLFNRYFYDYHNFRPPWIFLSGRRLFDVDLDISGTPVQLDGGSLIAGFQFGLTDLSNDGKQSASIDRLRATYSRWIAGGRVEAYGDLCSELVSTDRTPHSLITLGGDYYRALAENVQGRVGLEAYVGRMAEWDSTTSVNANSLTNSNTGWGDRQSGLHLRAGLSWRPEFGGVLDLAYRPVVSFVGYRDLLEEYPMMDTLSRGTNVENTSRWVINYQRSMTSSIRTEVSFEQRSDLHKPYLIFGGQGNWAIVTMESRASIVTARIEADLPHGIGVGGWGRITHEKTSGFLYGDNAPLVPPWELGVDASMPVGKDLMLSQRFLGRDNAHNDTYLELGHGQATWDIALNWRARKDLSASIGVDNLLGMDQIAPSGYGYLPRTAWVKIEWRWDNAR